MREHMAEIAILFLHSAWTLLRVDCMNFFFKSQWLQSLVLKITNIAS